MTRLTGSLLDHSSQLVETRHGSFRVHRYVDLARRRPALALAHGGLVGDEPVLARVHSSCVTSELFGGCDCDCAEQLSSALGRIAAEGRGVLFYLLQEGRGAGFVAKARDRMMVQASRNRVTTFEAYDRLGLPHDLRRYREIADIRSHLEISAPLRLLTNNPDKVARLEQEKVPVAGTEPLHHRPSPWNRHYLESKSRSGHALSPLALTGPDALPPFPVTWHAPITVPEQPRFARAASYGLAVRIAGEPGAGWLRCTVFADRRSGIARVILSGVDGDEGGPVLEQQLLDRLPLATPSPQRHAIEARIAAIVREGRGRMLLLEPEESGPVDTETHALLEAPLR